MSTEIEPIEAVIADLKPRMKGINITFRLISKGESREVTSRRDNSTHTVADAVVGDQTGLVTMPLWDESIENLEEDKTYRLENGYTTIFRNNLRLNIGKYGQISEAEIPIEAEEINNEVDMSLEEHEDYRRRRSYGGRSYGGGRDRSYGSGGRRDSSYGGRDRRRRY